MYLVRHGESEHNVDHSRMAHTHDSKHALTQLGTRQADAAAQFLQQHLTGQSVVFASPYLRTMQTAKAIHHALGESSTPLFENPLLREWELGNLYDASNRTNQSKKEFKAAGNFYFRYTNGESLADVYLRASVFMHTVVQRLTQKSRYNNLIIVSHAAFIQMMLSSLMNWPVDSMETFEIVENASVIEVVEDELGEYQYKKLFIPTFH